MSEIFWVKFFICALEIREISIMDEYFGLPSGVSVYLREPL